VVETDRHTDKLKANHASSTINPRPDIQPMPLNTPNTRSTWEKAQVLTCEYSRASSYVRLIVVINQSALSLGCWLIQSPYPFCSRWIRIV
jgi:hypothetical protein